MLAFLYNSIHSPSLKEGKYMCILKMARTVTARFFLFKDFIKKTNVYHFNLLRDYLHFFVNPIYSPLLLLIDLGQCKVKWKKTVIPGSFSDHILLVVRLSVNVSHIQNLHKNYWPNFN